MVVASEDTNVKTRHILPNCSVTLPALVNLMPVGCHLRGNAEEMLESAVLRERDR